MLNPISRFFGLLGRLFQSGADKIEDPSYVLERAFSQQQQALEETRRGRLELETISARLDIESRQLADGVGACEEQARRALTAGREDLARISLARREELDDQLSRTQYEREHLEEERRTLQRQESELAGAVQAFRSRKEVLKAQYGATQARLRVGEALTGYSRTVTTVGDDVRRFEDRLLTLKARTRALETVAIGPVAGSVMAPSYVDRELKMIGASPRIQEAVERLRNELGLPSPQRHVQPAAVEAARVDVPQLEAARVSTPQPDAAQTATAPLPSITQPDAAQTAHTAPPHAPLRETTSTDVPHLEAAS